jgi:hypothetical protein
VVEALGLKSDWLESQIPRAVEEWKLRHNRPQKSGS